MVVGGEDVQHASRRRVQARQFAQPSRSTTSTGRRRRWSAAWSTATIPARTRAQRPDRRPADHVQLYVLNDAMTPVPEGVPGELCVSRFGLARGYRAGPDATDGPFVAHPFRPGRSPLPHRRPGAVQRSRARSNIWARIDRQIKVAGMRVEPGEIEAALLSSRRHRTTCFVTSYSRGRPAAPGPDPGVLRDAAACRRTFRTSSSTPTACAASAARSKRLRIRARGYFRSMDDLRGRVPGIRTRRQADATTA